MKIFTDYHDNIDNFPLWARFFSVCQNEKYFGTKLLLLSVPKCKIFMSFPPSKDICLERKFLINIYLQYKCSFFSLSFQQQNFPHGQNAFFPLSLSEIRHPGSSFCFSIILSLVIKSLVLIFPKWFSKLQIVYSTLLILNFLYFSKLHNLK